MTATPDKTCENCGKEKCRMTGVKPESITRCTDWTPIPVPAFTAEQIGRIKAWLSGFILVIDARCKLNHHKYGINAVMKGG